jgi:hypothetical protein
MRNSFSVASAIISDENGRVTAPRTARLDTTNVNIGEAHAPLLAIILAHSMGINHLISLKGIPLSSFWL